MLHHGSTVVALALDRGMTWDLGNSQEVFQRATAKCSIKLDTRVRPEVVSAGRKMEKATSWMGQKKWTDLKGFFCPDTRQIPAIEQDTVPDYSCIVIPGVF